MWMYRRILLCTLLVVFLTVINAQWSPWSQWGICTKLCDGGVAKQIRRCESKQDCEGPHSRYRLCNTRPCPDNSVDFRDLQCAGFNTKRSREEWVAYHNKTKPCALICRAIGTGIIEEKSRHVVDGTKCSPGRNDICLRGECKAIGCDGTLDRDARLDYCGVCRGDGSTCSRYTWVESEFGPCTVTCGVGRQNQHFYCKDVKRNKRVKTRKCDQERKPYRQTKTCDMGACKPSWVIEEWSECSQSCGKGIRVRDVFCGLRKPSGMFKRLEFPACTEKRPVATKQCHEGDCPVWLTGKWTKCSVTCGVGLQYRKSHCSSQRLLCPSSDYPPTTKSCHTGAVCPYANQTEIEEFESKEAKEAEVISGGFEFDDQSHDKASVSKTLPYVSDLYDQPQADKPPPVKSKPAWAVILRGPCSTTCGRGIRAVTIECRHYNYRTNTFQTAPTYKCLTAGPKPSDIEECKNKPCVKPEGTDGDFDNRLPPKKITYLWRYAGFKTCSASCLGGVREAIVDCLEDKTHSSVSQIYCDPTRRPQPIKKPCNNVPCPPSWLVKHYGECSATCGRGVVKLHVECVQRYGHGEHEKVVLPSYRCGLDELPTKGRYCAEIDCPREWIAGTWSKCSPMCGRGLRMRDVYCQQKKANGTMRKLWGPDEQLCPVPRPDAWKSCRNTDCGGTPNEVQTKPPEINEDTTKLVQTRKTRRMKLMVGGDNTIIPGTSLVISCPVKNFRKKEVKWSKAGRSIHQIGRVRKTKSGVLKIIRSRPRDTGVYSCEAGTSKSNISVHFHSAHMGYSLFVQRKKYLNLRAEMLDQATSKKSFLSDAWTAQNSFNYSMTPYDFVTGEWSHCSSTCGGDGLQVRPISCEIIMEEYYKVVPESMCASNRPKKLVTKKPCGLHECPQWMVKGWKKKCSNKCVGERLAVQHRRAYCMFKNGTKLGFKNCSQSDMPSMERECTNGRCEAFWRVTPWSKCSAKCGEKGIKTRAFQCVWKAGKRPAGRTCEHKDRPEVKKPCEAPPCTGRTTPKPSLLHNKRKSKECSDHSPYCSIAKKMRLCRYQAYQKLCCMTCAGAEVL